MVWKQDCYAWSCFCMNKNKQYWVVLYFHYKQNFGLGGGKAHKRKMFFCASFLNEKFQYSESRYCIVASHLFQGALLSLREGNWLIACLPFYHTKQVFCSFFVFYLKGHLTFILKANLICTEIKLWVKNSLEIRYISICFEDPFYYGYCLFKKKLWNGWGSSSGWGNCCFVFQLQAHSKAYT